MHRIFEALDRQFATNRRLVLLARKLYHGLDGQSIKAVREHVDVTGDRIGDLDTFGSDEPIYELVFTVFGKGPLPTRVAEIMEELERTFKDCNLKSGYFGCSAMQLTGCTGPRLVDGVYTGSMTFELSVTRAVNLPATRRAG